MQTQQLKKEFANGLGRILTLTRVSLGAESAAFYWINREKEQFVLASESHLSSGLSCVVRSSFKDHYLQEFKELDQPVILSDPQDLATFRSTSYFSSGGLSIPQFKQLILFPIIRKRETVALVLFAIQRLDPVSTEHTTLVLEAFQELFEFYFSLSGSFNRLRAQQEEWLEYDQQLQALAELSTSKKSASRVLSDTIDLLYSFLQDDNFEILSDAASLVFAVQSLSVWTVVLEKGNTSLLTDQKTAIGMRIEKHTLAMKALESGSAEFLVHANPSPYRISSFEIPAIGASLSIPLLLDGHRVGVFVFTHPNPRFFSEAITHKLKNTIQFLSLVFQKSAHEKAEAPFQDRSGVLTSDLWHLSLQQILAQANQVKRVLDPVKNPAQNRPIPSGSEQRLVFLTPAQLPSLRTRYRLEELKQFQDMVAKPLAPGQSGLDGWVGRYSEYVFVVFVVGKFPIWTDRLLSVIQNGFILSGNQSIPIHLHYHSIRLDKEQPVGTQLPMDGPNSLDLHKTLRELNSGLTHVISTHE